MEEYQLETELVIYNDSAVKVIPNFTLEAEKYCARTHWHERMEFIRVTKGMIKIDFGDETFTVKENEAAVIPPRKPHNIFAVTDIAYSAVVFDIRNFYNKAIAGQKALSEIYEGNTLFYNSTDNSTVISILDDIIQLSSNKNNSFDIIVSVYNLISALKKYCIKKNSQKGTLDNSILAITEYLDENFSNEITIFQLSKLSGYTQQYFCKKFKDTTGLTPVNYLKIVRVEKAYEMIKAGETDINSLAYNCGFSEPNYFTRCFKAHFGHPPTYFTKSK